MSQSRIASEIVLITLGLVVSTGAFAQAVLQSVVVKVHPGKMAEYQKAIGTLQGVMDRVGGGGRVQMWNATLAGTGTGTSLVGVGYPSLSAFAKATTQATADPEWQKTVAGLEETRTMLSQALLVAQDGGGPPAPVASGTVLQGILVEVEADKVEEYVEQVGKLNEIMDRLDTKSSSRVWQATVAGDNTGMIAVGVTHPSLEAYADTMTKINGDSEASDLLEDLEDIRTIVSRSLYVAP
ncbi:MAG: hypothetical protein QNK05_13915 [Myxococcota bacterium]|nr:hypothetical protein [Myxococcota bacterium]